MVTYGNLHLANNIDALDLLAKSPEVFSSFKNFDQIFKIFKFLDKIYKEAQQDPLNQERTYILLVRYLHLYDRLLRSQQDKKFVEVRLESDYKRVKVQYEEVRRSLICRYAERAETKAISDKPTPKLAPSVAKQAQIFNSDFITCPQLHSALQKKPNILLIDARPDYDFKQSRINVPFNCINVPEQCITAGLSANALGKKLDPDIFKIWEKRDTYDVLVLFDWDTTSDNFASTKLEHLRSALVDWDFNRNYSEKPAVLNGGYLELLQMYPTLCINPQVYLSKRNNELDELLDIDNIEYPTETDNKAHVMGLKTTKVANAEDCDPATRDALIKENKKLAIDMQQVISKLLDAEGQWKKINDTTNQETDFGRVNELKNQQTQVQDEISKLEKSLEKLNLEKERVKKKFDLYAKFDPQNEALKSAEIEEILKIEEDDSEKLKILDTIAEERCKALQKARALKPKLNDPAPTTKKAHNTLKPTINRATKPSKIGLAHALVGPLEHITPGRVGLKNIRNTCYMNTLIQCLRNVPLIMELFCEGSYAKYEIRSPAAIIYETAYLIRYLWSKVVKFIEPYDFYQKVCTLEPSYGLGNHEDCMEFFLFLLNHLSEDCSYDIERPTVMTPRQKAWYTQFQGRNSVFIDLFYHQIRIQQICKVCSKSAYKYEIESTFMLPVPEHDFTLDQLMKEYMADFIIPEYCCSQCKKPVTNKKNICYEPKIVVIVLKRYKQVVHGGNVSIKKIDSKGHFKKNDFKIGGCYYQLNSIVLHSGDMNHGHYTAACLTEKGWFEFNDEIVRPINVNDDFVKTKACAFFYSVCDDKGTV